MFRLISEGLPSFTVLNVTLQAETWRRGEARGKGVRQEPPRGAR